MISSTSSVSRTVDLLSSLEEQILQDLINYITQRTNRAKSNLIDTLSKLISTAYFIGGDRAAKEIGGYQSPLGMGGLDPVIEKLGTTLDTMFGSMSSELTDIIKGGIRDGRSNDHVRKALAEKITSGWGKSIKFDSTGTVRKSVKVAPDGSLSWEEKTITQSITLPTEVYADTLARTSLKQAYAGGHFAQYEQAGYPGWIYISVADERTRPTHLALHGRVFLFGTEEEQMARKVMAEYNCRCRPKVYFGDPKLDRPDEEYRAERRKWARQALDESEVDDEEKQKFLEEIAGESSTDEIKFSAAKSLTDAEKWVKESTKLKIVDYTGLDVQTANEFNKSLAQHLNLDRKIESNIDFVGTCQTQATLDYEQRLGARIAITKKMYPELDPATIERLAAYGLVKAKVPGNTFAWSWRPLNNAGIGINMKWGKDVEGLNVALKRNVDTKFHPVGCDTIKSMIDHEFGHALDDLYKFRDMDEIATAYKDLCSMGNDKAKELLSLYAMSNRKEFIAEAWSEYLNNPKPRSMAKKIGGIIERIIKENQK